MKTRLLFLLFFASLAGQCQTITALPAGSVAYGNTNYLVPGTGKVIIGSAGYKFRYMATQRALDSLFALTKPLSYVPSWTDITGKPTFFSGSYNDLTDKPSIPSTEVDPTVSSAVKAITPTNIANWNNAFGWGNHAGLYKSISYIPSWTEITGKPTIPTDNNQLTNGNGYISSYTETDPTVSSAVKAITSTNISNWNAAFGWGDHAGLYVPVTRTLTIYGTSYSLSADRTIPAPTLDQVVSAGASTTATANFGNITVLGNVSGPGANLLSITLGGSTVSNNNGAIPKFQLDAGLATKQGTLSLTTSGSGIASLVGNVLNIPAAPSQYWTRSSASGSISGFKLNTSNVGDDIVVGNIYGSSLALGSTTVTSDYTPLPTDYVINCTGFISISLQGIAYLSSTKIFIIKNSGTGTITINAPPGGSIDGADYKTLTTQYSGYALMFQPTSGNYIVIGAF